MPAQQDSLTTLAFGASGGFYSHGLNLTNTSRAENQVLNLNGLQFGASLRYFNNRAVGFLGEINFTEGGWKESADPNTPNFRRKQSFVELQIMTQIAIGRRFIRPILQAGPYVSFPLRQDDTLPSNFPLPGGEHYYGQDLPFRPNYGLAVGTGLYFALGPVGVQLEGRGIFGVSDLVKSGSFGVSTSRRQSVGGRVTVFYEVRQ